MIAIYSIKIFCDGTSVGKTMVDSVGYYPDYTTPANPAVIVWSESQLAESTDTTTTIDGVLASKYAAILAEAPDLETSFEVDSPVVKNSSVTITVANHEKTIHLLEDQGVSLAGLPVRISLNQFDDAGAMIGTVVKFSGILGKPEYNETRLTLSCESAELSSVSNILTDGEIFTAGVSSDTDDAVFALKKIDTDANPAKTIYTSNGAFSFLIIGGYDTINGTSKKRIYQIHARTVLNNLSSIVGMWMYVDQSATDSKGQYRKILSITSIEASSIRNDIKATNTPSNYLEYFDFGVNAYYEITIDGAYSQGLEVDLSTFVQFVNLHYQYQLSKAQLSGTIDTLFSKADDTLSAFGTEGYACTLESDGSITIAPKYIIDDDTIATYTGFPCTELSLIGNSSEVSLSKWQYTPADDTDTDLFTNIYKYYCKNNGGYEYGVFHQNEDAQTTIVLDALTLYNNRLIADYAWYTDDFICDYKHFASFQFSLPAIPDNFKFKEAYVGLAISARCAKGLSDPGIKCITREQYGNAKEHFTIPLIQQVGGVSQWGHISTVPPWYCTTFNSTDFYDTDWQWETINADGSDAVTRFTNLEKCKLKEIDTVEKYRAIDKVGLFFSRDINSSSSRIFDQINFHEICVIFKHENGMSEVFV